MNSKEQVALVSTPLPPREGQGGGSIEIDTGSGFCFGVTRAIGKAEEELQNGRPLYCLGDIVHNDREVERLQAAGLITIDHEQFAALQDANVLLRAHGEPPSTYEQAQRNHIHLIDATCPVVLHLQERIKREYDADTSHRKQIVIFGKRGHAEVLGLVGQTEGTAIVIETPEEATRLDFQRDIALYSQTTKSLEGFRQVVEYIQQHIKPSATFTYYDTICRQVANRIPHIREFATQHDIVLFVCGHKSSNGHALFQECSRANARSFMIEHPSEIAQHTELIDLLHALASHEDTHPLSIGICGATSTPKWLMGSCKTEVEKLLAAPNT